METTLIEVTTALTGPAVVLSAGDTTIVNADFDFDAAVTQMAAALPAGQYGWYRVIPTAAEIAAASSNAAQAPAVLETLQLSDAVTQPSTIKQGTFSLLRVRSAEHPAWFAAKMTRFFKGGADAAAVKKALARDIADGEDRTWVIALNEHGEVASFAAVKGPAKNGTCEFVHAFTTDTYRHYGLHRQIIRLRVQVARDLGGKLLRATATALSKPSLEAAGFRAVIKKGQYDVMELSL